MRRAALTAAVLALVLSGCGTSDDRDQARDAAQRLYAATEASDGQAACEALTQEASEALEQDAKQPCEQAILDVELNGSRVAGTKVYITNAEVQFAEGDLAFLDRTSQGWRVSAAGCKARAGLPADCELED